MNPGMALALLPHAKWLQAQLQASEGFVLAQSDDHWAFGDPKIPFDTPAGQGLLSRFTDRAETDLGMLMNLSKFVVGASDMEHDTPLRHSMDANGLPWAMPLGGVVINNAFHPGIVVSGVPIGDAQFVRCKLGEVVQRSVSDNDDLVNALQNVAPQHLSGVQRHCRDSQFNHWLQHCHPADAHATVKPLQVSLDATFAAGSGFPAAFIADSKSGRGVRGEGSGTLQAV